MCSVTQHNQPKQRRDSLYYALLLLTAGYFGVFWVYLMNRDIQQVDPTHLPHLQRLAAVGVACYAASLGVIAYAIAAGLPAAVVSLAHIVGFGSALALSWLVFGGMLAAARYVRKSGGHLPGNFVLCLLTFTLGISLPLVQRRLNRAVSRSA